MSTTMQRPRTFVDALWDYCDAEREAQSEAATDGRVKVVQEAHALLLQLAMQPIRQWDLGVIQDEAKRLLCVFPCAFRMHESFSTGYDASVLAHDALAGLRELAEGRVVEESELDAISEPYLKRIQGRGQRLMRRKSSG